ncbi:MAG: hypothetical protein LBS59_05140 [Puniceicoccales bacterium]|nr:hypothetical protein [Puniceicoccales bacterium]
MRALQQLHRHIILYRVQLRLPRRILRRSLFQKRLQRKKIIRRQRLPYRLHRPHPTIIRRPLHLPADKPRERALLRKHARTGGKHSKREKQTSEQKTHRL